MDNFHEMALRPAPVPIGTRIELISMPDDIDPVLPGTQGTVTYATGAQIAVDWDNGRKLAILVGHDIYRVVKENENE